jgi:hypothetical protein
LKKYGYCEESLCPYEISRFTSAPSSAAQSAAAQNIGNLVYSSVAQDLDTMKGAIASRKAILFGFTVYESFESAQVEATGDVPMPSRREGVLGGHDVTLIGYDDSLQRFRFRNSWGSRWGKNGSGTFPYAFCTDPGISGDFWTIDSINGGNPTPPGPIPPGPIPPGPGPAPDVGAIRQAINQIFDAVKAQYPNRNRFALEAARSQINAFLDHPAHAMVPVPPEIIAIIDQIFNALIAKAQNPFVKMILSIAKGMIDAYLASMR